GVAAARPQHHRVLVDRLVLDALGLLGGPAAGVGGGAEGQPLQRRDAAHVLGGGPGVHRRGGLAVQRHGYRRRGLPGARLVRERQRGPVARGLERRTGQRGQRRERGDPHLVHVLAVLEDD